MPNSRATYFIECYTHKREARGEMFYAGAFDISSLDHVLSSTVNCGMKTVAVFFLIPKKYRQPELFNN